MRLFAEYIQWVTIAVALAITFIPGFNPVAWYVKWYK